MKRQLMFALCILGAASLLTFTACSDDKDDLDDEEFCECTEYDLDEGTTSKPSYFKNEFEDCNALAQQLTASQSYGGYNVKYTCKPKN